MMAQSGCAARNGRRLDDDEVDPQRSRRQWSSIGQGADLHEPAEGRAQVGTLAPIEGVLGQAEIAPDPPTDLDHDDSPGWSRVERHDVDLLATKSQVAGQDRPAECAEVVGHERLGGIAGALG